MRVLAVALVASCGYSDLPEIPPDAPANQLAITISPPAPVLHLGQEREVTITVTNISRLPTGTPTVEVKGVSAATFTLSGGGCTDKLKVGDSCTKGGRLIAPGASTTFELSATADPGGVAATTIALTVLPSCDLSCGPTLESNCCENRLVLGNAQGASQNGAPFFRSYDVASDGAFASKSFPATVGDFQLDMYEVTVGRFRQFVEAGMGTQSSPPVVGAGAHDRILNSGWQPGLTANLAPSSNALTAALACDGNQTWTSERGANESLPINCITWYEAFAFCIWDGGYLPTETEWNYAASGGSEQRAYPWSSPAGSTTIDCSHANFQVNASTVCINPPAGGIAHVGTTFAGYGRYTQADLAGNVWEWTLDWFASPYATTTCDDCANLTGGTHRVVRGGGFRDLAANQRAGARGNFAEPASRRADVGVRCARIP